MEWTKTAAFAEFGAVASNPVWSWSARSPDGSVVVLTFWKDALIYSSGSAFYDDTGWEPEQISQAGNRERMENIRWALEHLGGVVRAVIVEAEDPQAKPRSIKVCFPQKQLRMRITHFDQETGEFRAESVAG
ncbi:hypothetical protein [Afifella sp. IM 167]|uniref:hypothetical protein n=1 Tax=Afifella sp. IM 167 TaxID=2033586 RepID=UPI001CC9A378|nr:hypothetical protein [Afifella sp. IM 167]MBZ8132607.1 hypothetical protein [Afifella sp. IM 167]